VILADEINRTPPKTQAALLEAMQEAQVTVGGVRHALSPPFFVLATQNPIEQEGTYPLPEAQQDRFMFKVLVGYPPYADEFAIAERTTGGAQPELTPVLALEEILRLQEIVRQVPAAPSVIHYALNVVRSTRPSAARSDHEDTVAGRAALPAPAAELIDRMVTFGAGPRAVQFLLLGGKVRALLNGRHHVAREDVQALAHPVLRHRIITNYAAEAEGYDTDRIIQHIVESLPAGRGDESANAQFRQVFTS
jgi:MoxR-like ATPase